MHNLIEQRHRVEDGFIFLEHASAPEEAAAMKAWLEHPYGFPSSWRKRAVSSPATADLRPWAFSTQELETDIEGESRVAICVISDGSADLSMQLIRELDIRIVPLTVRFGDEVMGAQTEAAAFYEKMRSVRELPKTASPSPHDFADAFRAVGPDNDILVLPISSALSSTYQNAQLAKQMLLEDGTHRGSIEVLDSFNASAGLGLLAYRAAKLVREGTGFDELLHRMKAHIAESKLYVFLDTLDNVIKGGRLDRARGAVASLLNIKLIMKRSDEGTLEVVDKVRGSQQALRRMIDKLGEAKINFEQAILSIAHSNCEAKARALLADILAMYPFRDVLFSDMGPVIGTYAGEGAILIAY